MIKEKTEEIQELNKIIKNKEKEIESLKNKINNNKKEEEDDYVMENLNVKMNNELDEKNNKIERLVFYYLI